MVYPIQPSTSVMDSSPPKTKNTFSETDSSFSTLTSMASHVSFGLLRAVASLLEMVISLMKKPTPVSSPKEGVDLLDPKQLISYWAKRSEKVNNRLVALLDENPKVAMTILVNLAKHDVEGSEFKQLTQICYNHAPSLLLREFARLLVEDFALAEKIALVLAKDWKAHPDKYLDYQKNNNQLRIQWVAAFEKLFKDFFFTKELREFYKKANSGDSEEHMVEKGDFIEFSDLQKDVVNQYENYKKVDQTCSNFWDYCLSFIETHHQWFSGLNLNCSDEHVQGEDKSTFGDFFERMLNVFNPRNLRSDRIFNQTVTKILEFIEYMNLQMKNDGSKPILFDYPAIAGLLINLQKALDDQEKTNRVRTLVSNIVSIYYPSGKGSHK